MSQSEFARKLHLDRSYISRIENGEREWPEALDAALAKAGAKVAEIERAGLRQDVEQVLGGRWPDKPGQLDIAI